MIVIEREYRTRVFKRSFILLTLLMPLLFVAMSVLPSVLLFMNNDEQRVAIIDRTGLYVDLFKSTEQYTFEVVDLTMNDIRAGHVKEDAYTAFLEIRQDLRQDPKAVSLYSYNTLPSGLEEHVAQRLSDYVTNQKLEAYDIPNIKEIIRESKVKISPSTYKLGEDGMDVITSGAIAAGLGVAIAMAIYMFISIYGGMVLQGVMEEKKSRIMEVMVSSIRPQVLMMGKIIGIGLVGLTQIVIWSVLLTILWAVGLPMLMEGMSSASSGSASAEDLEGIRYFVASMAEINFWEIGVLFVFYFIGGYLLYASIYAALGSSVSSDEDSAQLTLPATLLMLASFYVGFACVDNPESTLALWASYIPFTSPLVMMVRVPYGVALWEQVLSIVVLYTSFILITLLAGRIYRVGVLMYGKKPTLRELWRWLRY